MAKSNFLGYTVEQRLFLLYFCLKYRTTCFYIPSDAPETWGYLALCEKNDRNQTLADVNWQHQNAKTLQPEVILEKSKVFLKKQNWLLNEDFFKPDYLHLHIIFRILN